MNENEKNVEVIGVEFDAQDKVKVEKLEDPVQQVTELQALFKRWNGRDVEAIAREKARVEREENKALGLKVLKLRMRILELIAEFETETNQRLYHLYLDRTNMSLDSLYGEAPAGLENRLQDVQIRLEKKEGTDEHGY